MDLLENRLEPSCNSSRQDLSNDAWLTPSVFTRQLTAVLPGGRISGQKAKRAGKKMVDQKNFMAEFC